MSLRGGRHLVILGLGNIGSMLACLVARLPGAGRITLCDPQAYDTSNLTTQQIFSGDVGKPKVAVIAQRLRQLNRRLVVVPLQARLETVPRGRLRGDVILGALDSKAARQAAGEIAWRLGVPLVDAGVEAAGQLARVSVYVPAPHSPCIECGFAEADYQLLDVVRWCSDVSAPASTNAPAFLGSLAASLQAAVCEQVLSSRSASLAGRELMMSAAQHTHQVTRLTHNPRCRQDHRPWAIERLGKAPGQVSVRQALRLLDGRGSGGEARLRVEGHRFVSMLQCVGCSRTVETLRLSGRLRRESCYCGELLVELGFCSRDHLDAEFAAQPAGRRSLRSIGFLPADIVSVGDGQSERHFELGGKR